MSRHKRLFVFIICPAYIVLAWALCRWLFPATIWFPMAMFATLCGVPVLVVYLLVAPLLERISQVVDSESTYRRASKASLTGEATAFQKHLTEATQRVADSHQLAAERRRPPFSRLPLFLLIGEEGSGKTGTFLEAGLDPEVLSGQVHCGSGVTPTPLCNLWLVRGAVVADLSGKLFAADLNRWVSILTLLGGGRMRLLLRRLGRTTGPQTLRGVVLFCDVTQFAGTPDPTALENLATRIRLRLRPIGDVFRTDFPVYVVFSKTDKLKRDPTKDDHISVFRDYFGRLSQQEDQAILGCTLPPRGAAGRPASKDNAEVEGNRIGECFDNLYFSLAQHRLGFLARETDASRRPGIYEFPRELRRLRGALLNFLVEVFRSNDAEPGPVLQGFYFTGTREVPLVRNGPAPKPEAKSPRISTEATRLLRAEDMQTLLRGTATRAEPSRESLGERWVFVSDLFNRLIIGPRVAAVPRRYRPGDLIRMAYAGFVVAAGLILVGCIAYSYWGNTVQLTKTQLAVDATYNSRPPTATSAPLAELYRLYLQIEELTQNEQHAPWRLNFGLNHGDRVLPGVRNLYFRAFREYVLKDTVASLERTIQALPSAAADAHPYGRTLDEVRAYRALTAGSCAPNDEITRTAISIWRTGHSVDPEDRTRVQQQLNFYVRELRSKHVPEPLAEQAEVVDRGRAYLQSFSDEERVYRDAIEGGNETPVRSLADYSPQYRDVISVPPEVPPAFTRDGWKAVQSRLRYSGPAGDPCVLGASEPTKNKPAQPDFERTLRTMYVRECVKRWKEFLSGIKVNGYREGLSQADQRLGILSDQHSPILGVLCLIHKGTDFPVEPDSPGVGDIRVAFDTTHKLFPADANYQSFVNEATNKSYLDALGKLRAALVKSPQPGNAELTRAAQDGLQLVSQLTSRSGSSDATVQNEVKRILEAPFREGSGTEIHTVESGGAITSPSGPVEAFNLAVQAVCDTLRPMLQKYPFNPGSNSDTRTGEVQAVFSPTKGTLNRLAKFLVYQNGRWAAPPGVKLSPSFNTVFQRLMNISHALFPEGGMHYRLAVQPSSGESAVTLTIGGVSLSQGSQRFEWPGSDQDLELRVKLPGATLPRSYGGLWSIFSMMADADPRPTESDVFLLTNPHAGRHNKPTPILDGNGNAVTIRFQVQEFPGGVKTAFDRDFFTGLACPPRASAE